MNLIQKQQFRQEYSERDYLCSYIQSITQVGTTVRTGSFAEDATDATDMVLIPANGDGESHLGCRGRNNRYIDNMDEFTVRCDLPSGAKTEYEKIMSGSMDWMLYFFRPAGDTLLNGGICHGVYLDMDVYRQYENTVEKQKIRNYDGSAFFVYTLSSFPPDLILGRIISGSFVK